MDKTERIPEMALPRDEFSSRRRELEGHPEAIEGTSRVDLVDDYGNLTTWTIDTFKHGDKTTAFLQRMTTSGGDRFVLPPKVMAALERQSSSAAGKSRARGARKALDTRRLRGDVIGNPEALAKARKARRKK